MTRHLWISLIIVAAFAGPASASRPHHGAFAYETGGAFAWSNDFSSEDAARSTAVAECEKYSKGHKCTVIAAFSSQCAALADSRDDDGFVGWAAKPRLTDALDAAIANCNAKAGAYRCGVIAWTCPKV